MQRGSLHHMRRLVSPQGHYAAGRRMVLPSPGREGRLLSRSDCAFLVFSEVPAAQEAVCRAHSQTWETGPGAGLYCRASFAVPGRDRRQLRDSGTRMIRLRESGSWPSLRSSLEDSLRLVV